MSRSDREGARVLVVDDSPATLEVVGRILNERGHHVETAPDVPAAIDRLHALPVDLVITDFRMPGPDGLDLVRHVRENLPQTAVVMLTGFPSIEGAVEAVKGGAEAYLTKPFTKTELLDTVDKALAVERRRHRIADPALPVVLSGRSEAARALRLAVETHGAGQAPLLIEAGPGSGAIELARELHDHSERRNDPFAIVRCDLLGSHPARELFGSDDGIGAIGGTAGGTVALDGVGALGEAAQLHLLRLLQERRRVPVGGGRPRPADVRIIAIARRKLSVLAGGGVFRRDLLDRLSTVSIPVPALGERKEDIVDLVTAVAAREAALWGVMPPSLSDRALEALTGSDWNGGLTELAMVIRRLFPAQAGRVVDAADLPAYLRFQAVTPTGLLPTLREVEASHIRTVLERVDGNKTAAAKILGIDRKTLRSKIGL